MSRIFGYSCVLTIVTFWAATDCRAQGSGPPLQCTLNAAVTPAIRPSGRTERTGDLVMNCTGGTPAPAGQQVPAANIQIFLNTNITSRILSGVWSEALLMIDEPQPITQLICGDVNAPATTSGVCTIKGTGAGITTYDGSPGHPNVFQGQMAGVNSIVWTGIPFDAPGSGPVRVVRITNVRSDASELPAGNPSQPPAQLAASISTDWIPLNTPQAIVGLVSQGIQSSVQAPQVLQQCTSQNPALASNPGNNGTPQF